MDSLTISMESLIKGQTEQHSHEQFEQLVKEFLYDEQFEDSILEIKRVSGSSARVYKSSLKIFKSFLKERNVRLITEQDIICFENHLKQQRLSVFTVISHLSTLKSFFSTLFNRGLYPNIAKDIKLPKKPRGFMKDTLTKEQAIQLLESVQGNDIISKRDLAILNILLRCGLRSIEIERANIEDVRSQKGTPVLFVQGKGRDAKDEFVVLTPKAFNVVQEYLSLRKGARAREPLFASHGNRNDKDNSGRLQTRSIRRMVKKYLKKIGLNNTRLTCHSLRHTFATLALENNAPLLAIQKAMRHSNINTTTIYTHMLDRLSNGAETYIDI